MAIVSIRIMALQRYTFTKPTVKNIQVNHSVSSEASRLVFDDPST